MPLQASSMCACALLLGGLGAPAAARATGPRSFALNLVRDRRAESCIVSQRLAFLVEQYMGPVFVAAGEAEFAIEASLRRGADARSWEARVVVTDRRGTVLGTRELQVTAADCHALNPSLVLVIAIAIDSEIALRGLPNELLQTFPDGADPARDLLGELRAAAGVPSAQAGSAQAPAPDSHPTDSHPTDSHPTVPARVRRLPPSRKPDSRATGEGAWRWWMGGYLASAVGLLPRPSAGAGIAVGVEPPALWPIALAAVLWFENDAALKGGPATPGDAIHFRMTQFTAELQPVLFQRPNWHLHASVGFLAAHRWTDSRALGRGVNVRESSLGPLLGLDFAYRMIAPVWARLNISMHLPLDRDRFTYLDGSGAEQPLFTPAAVAVGGQLGLVFRL